MSGVAAVAEAELAIAAKAPSPEGAVNLEGQSAGAAAGEYDF